LLVDIDRARLSCDKAGFGVVVPVAAERGARVDDRIQDGGPHVAQTHGFVEFVDRR
jgi:hypothetical protein